MDSILLTNVNKSIKKKRILENINLALERGGTYVFAGRNASGKTMLLRTVAGLLLPDSGDVDVFGQEISRRRVFPKDMGLMIEHIELWNHLTGIENLDLLASIKHVIGNDEIRTALSRVGLDPDDKRKFKAYSLGMKQKLVLAQAIMERPTLLILDEPTNGLDEEAVALFQTVLQEERQRGTTCLIATHQLEDIQGFYDSLYRMKDGKCSLVEAGGQL